MLYLLLEDDMKSYKETLNTIRDEMEKDSFSFPNHDKLDYIGVGFGYNLQESYPKTMKQAEKDIKTPHFDAIVKKIR